MKVVMLTHSLRRGGAERVCLELSKGLISLGLNVEIISWIAVDEYTEDEYNILNRYYLISKLNYKWIKSLLKSALILRKLLNNIKPDIILIHSTNTVLLYLIAMFKRPSIQIIHGYDDIINMGSFKHLIYNYIRRFNLVLLNSALVTVSKTMKPTVSKYFNVSEREIYCINNGVDIDKFSYINLNRNLIPQVIMIGTLCSNKGQLFGIQAFEILLKIHPNASFIIVGDGEDMPFLQDQIDTKNLNTNIKLLGRRSDVNMLLSDSTILWHLSESEGLPMAILEAMSIGIPAVGFDVRGIKDVIINDETGYLVPFKDINKVASLTSELLVDQNKWEKFSTNSRARVEKYFSKKIMIESYYDLINRLAKK
jgi:glycosyltransferase involved in cell wall biosynthesis